MERLNPFVLLRGSIAVSIFLIAGNLTGCDSSVQSNGLEATSEPFAEQPQPALQVDGDTYTFEASNGYTVTLTGTDSFAPGNGSVVAVIESPRGETMEMEVSQETLSEGGSISSLEFDGLATIDLAYSEAGGLASPDPTWESFRVQYGGSVIEAEAMPLEIDDSYVMTAAQESAIRLFSQAAEDGHSKDFYDASGIAFAEFQQAMADENLTPECAGAILTMAGSFVIAAATCAGSSGILCAAGTVMFVGAGLSAIGAC